MALALPVSYFSGGECLCPCLGKLITTHIQPITQMSFLWKQLGLITKDIQFSLAYSYKQKQFEQNYWNQKYAQSKRHLLKVEMIWFFFFSIFCSPVAKRLFVELPEIFTVHAGKSCPHVKYITSCPPFYTLKDFLHINYVAVWHSSVASDKQLV